MSSSDDDHGGDDDQLNQLRSVWVSMRESDEDPPDRGLDALMAAARTKAATLAPPPSESFWTKVLAVFRRPPVFALASITVLLGGALFIANRRDSMQSEETVSDRRERAASPAGSSAVVASPEPPASPPTTESAAPTPALPPPAETPRPSRPRAIAKRPQREEKELDSQAKGGGDQPTVTGAAAPGGVEEPVKPAPTSATRGPIAKPTDAASSNDTFGETLSLADEAEAKAARPATQPQITQLVKQCESAAARNDCAAVRTLAKKIKSTDPEAHKRLAANAAVARCLN